jgi:hypothetical protein
MNAVFSCGAFGRVTCGLILLLGMELSARGDTEVHPGIGTTAVGSGEIPSGNATAGQSGDSGQDAASPTADDDDDEDDEPKYKLDFHGFLRIPAESGFEHGKMHSPPHTPDFNYTDWSYTNNMGGPWTEMWFTYGDKTVSASVVLEAYDIAEASYKNLQAQLGIAQSFITLNFPTLLGEKGGLTVNAGAFVGRYGMAGRYDAGTYDTYLFGATHAAGETAALTYRLTDRLQLDLEHGIGAKLDIAPLVPGLPDVPYLPYPGDVQQGSTFLHHVHLSFTLDNKLTLAFHDLYAFTKDSENAGEPDGSIHVFGAELKLWESIYGQAYLGFARMVTDNPLRVAGVIETAHSFEGWEIRDNYFAKDEDSEATGTGKVDTVLFEYNFSLATLLWAPEEFWGQAPDIVVSLFGMYNHVQSDDPAFAGTPDNQRGKAGEQKLKMGGSVTYSWKKWLAFQGRYDLVQPNLHDNTQSFQVISPSVIFSSRFASNEQIILQYSHYVNGKNVHGGYPYEALPPDQNSFRIAAVMWW